jgi:hypothetical protein
MQIFSSNLYLGYRGKGSRFLTMEVKKLNKNSRIGFMVFNSTLNNISVISWLAVLLVEETTDLLQVTDKLSHNVVSSGIRTLNFSGDRHTDCKGSCKSNYHMITTPIIVLDKIGSVGLVETHVFLFWPDRAILN